MRVKIWLTFLSFTVAFIVSTCRAQQNPVVVNVDVTHPGNAISPQMFGIFFEDINFAADGGLYPELVKNRSFEFDKPLTGRHEILRFSAGGIDNPKGELSIQTEKPLNETNPHYLRARVYEP